MNIQEKIDNFEVVTVDYMGEFKDSLSELIQFECVNMSKFEALVCFDDMYDSGILKIELEIFVKNNYPKEEHPDYIKLLERRDFEESLKYGLEEIAHCIKNKEMTKEESNLLSEAITTISNNMKY